VSSGSGTWSGNTTYYIFFDSNTAYLSRNSSTDSFSVGLSGVSDIGIEIDTTSSNSTLDFIFDLALPPGVLDADWTRINRFQFDVTDV
jgi:hypothetical protein